MRPLNRATTLPAGDQRGDLRLNRRIAIEGELRLAEGLLDLRRRVGRTEKYIRQRGPQVGVPKELEERGASLRIHRPPCSDG